MTERIIPDCMKVSGAVKETAKTEQARFENVEVNSCPVCHVPLRRSEANGISVMICDSHAICMPTKDEE